MHIVETNPPTDPATTGTHGINLWSLAKSLGMPRTCPECAAGALTGINWHRSIPVELQYSCGHSAIPLRWGKEGRHRKG